jgi:hypothetical protein
MAASPPISPKVATPLAHRKRRFSALDRGTVIDLTGPSDEDGPSSPIFTRKVIPSTNRNGAESTQVAHTSGTEQVRKLEDESQDGDDEDDKSLMEDMLDTAELEPYEPGELQFSRLRRSCLELTTSQMTHKMRSSMLRLSHACTLSYARLGLMPSSRNSLHK